MQLPCRTKVCSCGPSVPSLCGRSLSLKATLLIFAGAEHWRCADERQRSAKAAAGPPPAAKGAASCSGGTSQASPRAPTQRPTSPPALR